MRVSNWVSLGLGVLLLGTGPEARAGAPRPVTLRTTPDGIEFGILGEKPASPAPTVFICAQDIQTALTAITAGRLLVDRGYLCVALDLPCHGKDNPEQFTNALAGWCERLKRGDDLIPSFTAKCARVLDFLIAEG